MPELFKDLKEARTLFERNLRNARLIDSVRLKREWNRLDLRDLPPETVPENGVAISIKRLLERAGKAGMRSLKPLAEKLVLEYPSDLPVSARSEEIVELIKHNQVLIVAGATGSGKTTQLPKMALAAGSIQLSSARSAGTVQSRVMLLNGA